MTCRKLPKLGLLLMVRHPESDDPEDHCTDLEGNPIYGPVDSDGHYIDFQVGRMGGTELAEVELRRGMASSSAARILRKLADLVERNPGLLTARQGIAGEFDESGSARLILCAPFDDFGNLPPMPDIG